MSFSVRDFQVTLTTDGDGSRYLMPVRVGRVRHHRFDPALVGRHITLEFVAHYRSVRAISPRCVVPMAVYQIGGQRPFHVARAVRLVRVAGVRRSLDLQKTPSARNKQVLN